MTLVSLQMTATQQSQQRAAGRKRSAQEQQERPGQRPRRASRHGDAQGSADQAHGAGTEPAAAAAIPTATRLPDPAVVAERAAHAAAKLAQAERRRGELLDAYRVFQEQAAQRQLFMEVDAGECSHRCAPTSLPVSLFV